MKLMSFKRTKIENSLDPALLEGDSPFRDRLLVAMPGCYGPADRSGAGTAPGLRGGSFFKSVVYICAHSPAGAMGIVINQKLREIEFGELLAQLRLPHSEMLVEPVVHFGGPVETGRGFVLHSTDFLRKDTVRINDRLAITGTVDILAAITGGKGPRNSIFALGYAGWGPGQLDDEMRSNAWLTMPADNDLIFNNDLTGKWERALLKMGVSPLHLSFEMGRA